MITGMFILGDGAYACSTNVEIDFASSKGLRTSRIIMKNAYNPQETLKVFDIVDCVLKYQAKDPVNFKACIRNIDTSNNIILSLSSEFKTDEVPVILGAITRLV